VDNNDNPFANLDALRQPQDYADFMGEAVTTTFPVRRLREGLHLRVNGDPAYRLEGQYIAETKSGAFFVFPAFRDAIKPVCKRVTIWLAVDGHGTYHLLLTKLPLPEMDMHEWYRTARVVAEAATREWVKVTKASSDDGWSYVPVSHQMFEPKWPDKSLEELLRVAFPDRVVNRFDHDLIKQFEMRGL
jgi:hypothetical protein